jgi:hypothetical protein
MAEVAEATGAPLPAPLPPAAVQPQGLVGGLFAGSDPAPVLDESKFPPNQVFLNIYDLKDTENIHNMNLVGTAGETVVLFGNFHAGLVVYTKEWCYESTGSEGTGVVQRPPRSHPQHTYRNTVPLGCTQLSEEAVEALLERLADEWPGREHDAIHHNSMNFCNALYLELGLGRIPGWVDQASRTASLIESTSRNASEKVEQALRLVFTDAQQAQAQELVEAARTQAQEIAEATQQQAAQAAQAAQQQAAQAAQAAQQQAQVLGEAIGQTAQKLVGDEFLAKAQELTERSQAHARSLWQRARAASLRLLDESSSSTAPAPAPTPAPLPAPVDRE